MRFDEKLEELAIEMKTIMFLELSGEADVVIKESDRQKYLDCSGHSGYSRVLTDAILGSVRNVITPLVLAQERTYDVEATNIVLSLQTGYKTYRFFIDEEEVYTTGAMYSYKGDYGTLGIEYTRNKDELDPLTSEDFPIEGEIFDSWKDEGVPIGKASLFTLTESENSSNAVYFNKIDYDRISKEVRYYFTTEEE